MIWFLYKKSVSVFFFFLSSFLLFLLVISLTGTDDSLHRREGRGNHYFSCFLFPSANKHLFSSSRFQPLLHFFLLNLFVITRPMAGDTCFPMRFAFLLMQLTQSHRLWHFKMIFWEFELISTYHSSITRWKPLTTEIYTLRHHCLSIRATPTYPQPTFKLYPFANMYKKWRMCHFFTRDWEKNNKKHFQSTEIGNDVLIYINIKLVFQMEIDYTLLVKPYNAWIQLDPTPK